MSLEAIISAAVTTSFDALGDLVKDCTIVEVGKSTSYDSASDTRSRAKTGHTCRAVLSNYSQEDMKDSDIEPEDFKVLISSSDIEGGYSPTTNDTFLDHQSVEYTITRVTGVPGNSLWTLRVRKV